MNEGATISKSHYCVSTLSNAILKLMKQVVLGRCWSNFQDVVGIYWSATAPAPSEHLFWARVRKECLHVSLSQVPHKFHEIMHRRRNRSSEAKLSAALTFDLWQQPIGNGRRYCKIQYNDTGTGSYPLPVEVPSPVLLGVGARCRCSRHSVCHTTWSENNGIMG